MKYIILFLAISFLIALSFGFFWFLQVTIQNTFFPVEDKWSFYILILTLVTIIVTASAITADSYYKNRRHVQEARDIIRLISNELKENKKTLVGSVHHRIMYTTETTKDNKKTINYVNAYLESDAYESILHSGLIKYLPIGTQSRLTMLYSRIRSRNKLITYMEHFEDLFFLYDDSEQRLNQWYHKIEKYDLLLTQWEADIVELLDEAMNQFTRVKPKSFKYILGIRYRGL
jgi:hypothetical protein